MNKRITGYLSDSDAILKNIIQTIPSLEIVSTQNVFHDLMSCIIEQQIHYRSTKKTFQKALQVSDIQVLTLGNFTKLEENGLKNVKMSMNKYQTLERVIDFFSENKINWSEMTDKEIRKILSQIKGIGVWTIDMILLYTLQRPDIFPADDYHVKKIMCNLYDIDTTSKVKAQLKAISEHWSPHKSLAVKYLLAWKAYHK